MAETTSLKALAEKVLERNAARNEARNAGLKIVSQRVAEAGCNETREERPEAVLSAAERMAALQDPKVANRIGLLIAVYAKVFERLRDSPEALRVAYDDFKRNVADAIAHRGYDNECK
jgi:hypothetical protein